jgi:hypothetical protein
MTTQTVVLIAVCLIIVALVGCAVWQKVTGQTAAQSQATAVTLATDGGGLAVNVLLDQVAPSQQAALVTVLSQELAAVSAGLTAGNVNIGEIIKPFQAQIAALVPSVWGNVLTLGMTALAGMDVSTAAIPASVTAVIQGFICGAQAALPAPTAPKALRSRDADIALWQNWLASPKK